MITAALLPLALTLRLAAPAGPAAPAPVRTYLAVRDAYVRDLAAKGDAATDAQERRARADLEKRLRAIVGPVRLPGLAGEGKLNLETLREDELGFGQLDGLRFEWGADTTLLVTTRPLLDAYLAADARLPADLAAVARSPAAFEDFFRRVFSADVAFPWFGDVPVRGAGVELALAALALPAQDLGPWPPTELAVVVVTGERVLVARSTLRPPPEQLAACEAEWTAGEAKADAARAAGASGRDQDRHREDAFDAYRRCYARELPGRPAFAAIARRAQELVDRLAR